MELVQDFVHDFDQDFDKISHQKECKKVSGGLPGASGKLQKGCGSSRARPKGSWSCPEELQVAPREFPEDSKRLPRGPGELPGASWGASGEDFGTIFEQLEAIWG